tara:strand:- start:2001 stop:3416 length:1416 start_codon:yes stop_codon:yes gene_type:complete
MNNKEVKKDHIMTMILVDDLNEYLSKYDDKIYEIVMMTRLQVKPILNISKTPIPQDNATVLSVTSDEETTSDVDIHYLLLKETVQEKLSTIYELTNKTDNFSLAKVLYLNDFIDSYFKTKVMDFNERIDNRKDILEKLSILKKLVLPEQRTNEWYAIRETILTASSLADAIGEGHFSTKDQLLIQKCGGPRGEVPFKIVEWGVMYEPVATKFYELMNNLTVLEFGLVPHPTFKIFGASPDGICDEDSPENYIGRMLEIKCPPKRQFTKEVPRHYWMQMQGQLESCNLEECDFLQVKFIEYFNEQDYNDDFILEEGILKEGYSSLNLPKGLLVAFVKDNPGNDPTIKYEYCDFYQSHSDLTEFAKVKIAEYKSSDFKYDRIIQHWWKIERYECVLVGRDRKWWLETQPKIIDFWEDVLHYRKVGIQVFHDLKAEKKIKRIKLKKPSQKKKNTFSIDKAVVENIKNNYLIDSD